MTDIIVGPAQTTYATVKISRYESTLAFDNRQTEAGKEKNYGSDENKNQALRYTSELYAQHSVPEIDRGM